MKIGLYDIDSIKPNLALMKLSAWHKSQGDDVSFYSPLFYDLYDKIYASKIFLKSQAFYLHNDMIRGGSGFVDTLTKKLPYHIEHIYPDYSLYNSEYAMGFITRGCIRKCSFCVVPKKEGLIRKNAELEEFCHDQKDVCLLDNNILAYKDHLIELKKLSESGKRFDFNQGLDIRLINEKNAKLLNDIRIWKKYRFAFDDPNLKELIEKKWEILKKSGFSPRNVRVYVLVGYNTTKAEDLMRINFLKKHDIGIFIMSYVKNRYTTDIARWVNRYFYEKESFETYCNKKKHTEIKKKITNKNNMKRLKNYINLERFLTI